MVISQLQGALRSVATTLLVFFSLSAFAQQDAPFTFGADILEPRNPPVVTANATGNYSVGIRRQSFRFHERQLNVSWWYPASIQPGSTPYISKGGISGHAVRDAPLDRSNDQYPLIIFSPGVGSHDDSYYFYCQNLASSGYIVVSINHLDATELRGGADPVALLQALTYMLQNNSSYTVWLLFSNWFRSTHFGLTYRPQEIDFVLDRVIAAARDPTSPIYNSVDTNKIGMAGHSLGGFYSLLKGSGMAINCDFPLTSQENNTSNPILSQVSICAWLEAKNLSSPTALHDPRIKAVIALAPPFFIQPAEIPRAAAAIKTPMMILTGNDPMFESTIEP